MAKVHLEGGLWILSEHVVLSSWASIEAVIRLLWAQWLRHQPDALQIERVARITGAMARFEARTATGTGRGGGIPSTDPARLGDLS